MPNLPHALRRHLYPPSNTAILILLGLFFFMWLRDGWAKGQYEGAVRMMVEREMRMVKSVAEGRIPEEMLREAEWKTGGEEEKNDSGKRADKGGDEKTAKERSEDTKIDEGDKGEKAGMMGKDGNGPSVKQGGEEDMNTARSGTKLQKVLQPTATDSVRALRANCSNLAGSDDVLLILKVGAAEVYQKLTQHFLTTFICVPNFIVWSDMEQEIGNFQVHDAIKAPKYGVSKEFLDKHKDFEAYRKFHQLFERTQDLSKVKRQDGWDLDKWKFLPMLLESYDMYPDKKWYVVIEADTYLSWTNLLLWLQKLPPDKDIYAGCIVYIDRSRFAHGGSSFLLSNPALKKLSDKEPDMRDVWEKRTAGDCCGDKILSDALFDTGVRPMNVWPMIQGETPTTLDFTARHWCSPALSWHHLSPMEVDRLWRFEQAYTGEHGAEKPIHFADHFKHFVEPQLVDRREDWDNLSKGPLWTSESLEEDDKNPASEKRRASASSWDACREWCDEIEDCLQYYWETGKCQISSVVKLGKISEKVGREGDPDNLSPVVSGWMLDRIKEFKEKHSPCDDDQGWLTELPKPPKVG